jgi:plastocyanin
MNGGQAADPLPRAGRTASCRQAPEEVPLNRSSRACVVLALAALGVASGAAAARQAAPPTLTGVVGPGYKISLSTNGRPVTSLKAGSYAFVVSDRAKVHDFVLEKKKGGTFEKELTGVAFVGSKAVQITLTPGKWEFYCRPHESIMHGDFTVR